MFNIPYLYKSGALQYHSQVNWFGFGAGFANQVTFGWISKLSYCSVSKEPGRIKLLFSDMLKFDLTSYDKYPMNDPREGGIHQLQVDIGQLNRSLLEQIYNSPLWLLWSISLTGPRHSLSTNPIGYVVREPYKTVVGNLRWSALVARGGSWWLKLVGVVCPLSNITSAIPSQLCKRIFILNINFQIQLEKAIYLVWVSAIQFSFKTPFILNAMVTMKCISAILPASGLDRILKLTNLQ